MIRSIFDRTNKAINKKNRPVTVNEHGEPLKRSIMFNIFYK